MFNAAGSLPTLTNHRVSVKPGLWTGFWTDLHMPSCLFCLVATSVTAILISYCALTQRKNRSIDSIYDRSWQRLNFHSHKEMSDKATSVLDLALACLLMSLQRAVVVKYLFIYSISYSCIGWVLRATAVMRRWLSLGLGRLIESVKL